MTHCTVQFNSAVPELATVIILQGTLENWRGTNQLWPL